MIELKKNKVYRFLLTKSFEACYDFILTKLKIRNVLLQRRFWFFGWRWKTVGNLIVESTDINNGYLTLNLVVKTKDDVKEDAKNRKRYKHSKLKGELGDK